MQSKQIRRAVGLSQMRVAVQAGVSEPTVRIYEISPDAVADDRKRQRLDAVYSELHARALLSLSIA